MRVLLFDPYGTGHHGPYLRELAADLATEHEVFAVASETVDLTEAPLTQVGAIKPVEERRRWHNAKMFTDAIDRSSADVAIHMFADTDLPALVTRRFSVPVTLLMFRPRSHYPKVFDSALTRGERMRGFLTDALLRLWFTTGVNRRAMFLDEYAAAKWGEARPDQVAWWPEPPARGNDREARMPGRILLYGDLSQRKGALELMAALPHSKLVKELVIAGRMTPELASSVRDAADVVRAENCAVDIRDGWIDHAELHELLASASVAAAAYPRHFGMSRVLIEAAAVGTPVVGPNFGLSSKLTREYGLGASVDPADPQAFAAGIDEVLGNGPTAYRACLSKFSDRYSAESRSRALGFILRDS